MSKNATTVEFEDNRVVVYDSVTILPSGWIFCRINRPNGAIAEKYPPHKIESIRNTEFRSKENDE